jgi:hypothetical protein
MSHQVKDIHGSEEMDKLGLAVWTISCGMLVWVIGMHAQSLVTKATVTPELAPNVLTQLLTTSVVT